MDEDKDIAILDLSAFVYKHPNIISLFIDNSMVEKMTNFHLVMLRPRPLLVERLASYADRTPFTLMYNNKGVMERASATFRYRINTSYGDCGAPVLI